MTVSEWRRRAEGRLSPEDAYDARLLICAALDVNPGQLSLMGGRQLTEAELSALDGMLARRGDGEPVQYIEGKAYFMGLAFNVDKRVLIPRQDTETLCEEALNFLKPIRNPAVLDMCTGSGALAVSIAALMPGSSVTAVDISADALEVAKSNAEMNRVKVEFVLSDGFTALDGRKFDLIVCNPPYLTDEDMNELQREVRREPELALRAGEDGLMFYRRFAKEAPEHLLPGGAIMFEVGMGQAQDVRRLLGGGDIIKDLCGVERVVKTVI